MNVTFPPQTGRLVRMLASDQDGETLAAARALKRQLASAGLTFHDVADRLESPGVVYMAPSAATAGSWAQMSRATAVETLHSLMARGVLTDWEQQFAADMARKLERTTMRPTPKQVLVLNRIFAKAGRAP